MKKFLRVAAFVLAVMTCLCAVGCKNPSEDEVISAYKEIYPAAYQLTEYIYGTGLPYDGEYNREELGKEYYVPVSESSPYKTKEEFIAAVLEVYTEEYYENTLKYVLFESLAGDQNGMVASDAPRYKTVSGTLYINVAFEPSTVFKCDTSKAYIEDIRTDSAVVGAPREGTAKDKKCYMVLTESGWRFDYRV